MNYVEGQKDGIMEETVNENPLMYKSKNSQE